MTSKRERQIAQMTADGLKRKDIASALGIAPATVQTVQRHIRQQTGTTTTRAGAERVLGESGGHC